MDSLDSIRKFLQDHVVGHQEFNSYTQSGAHALAIRKAADSQGLTTVKDGDWLYISDENGVRGTVYRMLTSLVSQTAVMICRSKATTKRMLEQANVPIPAGKIFKKTQKSSAKAYFASLTSPGVIKPDAGKAGKGVTAGITTEAQFETAWKKAAAAATGEGLIIVEEYVPGIDIRAYVVGDSVAAATVRVPPFVVGDGSTSIQELLKAKQVERETSRYLSRLPIVCDEEWLADQGWTMQSIPQANEIVLLSSTANVSRGGDSVDVTSLLPNDFKEAAVSAIRAIPGMRIGGVDFQAQSLESIEGAVILELNTAANISVHHLPSYGKPVDVGAAILQEMLRTTAE